MSVSVAIGVGITALRGAVNDAALPALSITLSQTGSSILVAGLYDADADSYQFRRETSPGVYETSAWITAASLATDPQEVFPATVTLDTTYLEDGTVMTLDPGVYAGDGPMTLSIRWLRDGSAITGQTGLTYIYVAATDDGTIIDPEVEVDYA